QMAHRITLVRMKHELRPCRRSRGEIQEERVISASRSVGCKRRIRACGLVEAPPPRCRAADADSGEWLLNPVELRRAAGIDDDVRDVAAIEAIADVVWREQRAGRNDNDAQLHACE